MSDKKHPGIRANPETRARAIAALGVLIARHKTKSALARALGVDRSSVRQWFNGRAFPSAKMATIILNEASKWEIKSPLRISKRAKSI